MQDGWRIRVAELRLAKRNAEALDLVRKEASGGNIAARVLLATMGNEAGLSRSEVDCLIDDVETNMDPRDIQTHVELSAAYDMRLGDLPYEEKARRSFDHLVKAVQLGAGPAHTLALARIYAMGALCVARNEEEAIRWYKHAIGQGSLEAAHELQEYYRHLDKQKRSL